MFEIQPIEAKRVSPRKIAVSEEFQTKFLSLKMCFDLQLVRFSKCCLT